MIIPIISTAVIAGGVGFIMGKQFRAPHATPPPQPTPPPSPSAPVAKEPTVPQQVEPETRQEKTRVPEPEELAAILAKARKERKWDIE